MAGAKRPGPGRRAALSVVSALVLAAGACQGQHRGEGGSRTGTDPRVGQRSVGVPVGSAAPADLPAAARAGDLEHVRALLDSGVPVDSTDRYGYTALNVAAGAGNLDLVRYLIERGADLDRADDFYHASPLQSALFSGHSAAAALLLRAGAEGREGALELALRRGDAGLARAAVEAGPVHASVLDALRAEAESFEGPLRALLEQASSRPDPEPPRLSPEELARFAGTFEGWASDEEVVVEVAGGALRLARAGSAPVRLEALAESTFRSADGTVQAAFFGRAGTIEGLALRAGDGPPETLRRSVAEPVGAGAVTAAPAGPAPSRRTVHWPGFRGRNADGIGDGVDTPVSWDLASGEHVRWRTALPGLGNSSPVIWGDRVFVTTAAAEGIPQEVRTGLTGAGEGVDEAVPHRWLVLAHDRRTGARLWEREVGRAVPLTRRHFKSSQANSTPVTDGRRLVVVFPTAGMACLDLDGNLLWRIELGALNAGAFTDPGVEWGFASSPVLYGDIVILQVDVHGGAYIAAWDLDSGEPLWRTERDVAPSWATPAIWPAAGGDELVANASVVHAYDPRTGRELWSLAPNSELVIAAPVVGDGVVYVSAGYPPVKPIYAVRAGTRGALRVEPGAPHQRLLWSHERGGAYMPTPLLYRGLLYVVHHNGRMVAYDARSGAAVYKSRFSAGGTFTASPIAVNGRIYAATEEGQVYVIEAGPEYRELAVNEMDEPVMATPAVSEGLLVVRTPRHLTALAQ